MAEAQNNQTQDLNQLLKVRREKLAALQEAGKDPFQITKFDQTHHTADAKALYEALEAELLAGDLSLTSCQCSITICIVHGLPKITTASAASSTP